MLFTIFAISLTSAPGIATITTITTVPIVAAATSVRPCITTAGAAVPTGDGARGLVGGGEVERAVAGGHLQYSGAVHSTLYSTVQQYLGVVQPQEVLLVLLQPQLTRQPPCLHKSASQNVSWVLLSHLFRGD